MPPPRLSGNFGTAHRTAVRHGEYPFFSAALCGYNGYHLGNNISRPLHHNGVADADILALDFILIVKRCMTHGNAADPHRF